MFTIKRREIGDVERFLSLPVTADETYARGEVLTLTAGKLTKASGTTKPTYIAVTSNIDNGQLLVEPVLSTTQFAVESTAIVASTLVGSAVMIGTDGLTVTATTTDGVFTIDETDGDKSVVGHFA